MSTVSLEIFDISQLHGQPYNKKGSKICDPIVVYEIEDNTYDSIKGVGLDPMNVRQSWVTLVSTNFSFVQVIRINDLLD